MSRFVDAHLGRLTPYVPGEQPQGRTFVKLNTNESPYPPAPGVAAALNRERIEAMRLYADPNCTKLRQAAADYHGLSPDQVLAVNGSDEALYFAFLAYASNRNVYYPDVTYGFYRVFASLLGAKGIPVPLNNDYEIDWKDYFGKDGMIVFANPNAPTGHYLTHADIKRIVMSNPDQVVLVDEAYIDYGGASVIPLIKQFDNLLVVQTFSKSRALAGLRLGFAFAQKALIDDLTRIRDAIHPYSVNGLAQTAGIKSFEDRRYFGECVSAIVKTRARTTQALEAMGVTVLPSLTNFLMMAVPNKPGEKVYKGLFERGVLVRYFDAPRTRAYVRVTIGSDPEMDAFLDALKEVIA
ncbi:MAG: histidinol-phosphate transaminase [Clostridiales bacterium]|nr:histidinol-phosphate transaminase [Clostridiales bacterium]